MAVRLVDKMRLPCGGPQAAVEMDGRMVVVTADDLWTLHLHDLATGTSLLTARRTTDGFAPQAIAVTELDGQWIAVTGEGCHGCSDDPCMGELRRWSLADGSPIGAPVRAHPVSVTAVALTRVAGRPVAVTGGRDGGVGMWDLRTGEAIGEPAVGHRMISQFTAGVHAIAVGELDGRPIAVTGAGDGSARVWELTGDGVTPGRALLPNGDYDDGDGVHGVALGELDGVPVVVTAYEQASVWDLRTGEMLRALDAACILVGLARVEERPVLVTADPDGRISAWDLSTGERVASTVAKLEYFARYLTTAGLPDGPVVLVSAADTAVVAIEGQ